VTSWFGLVVWAETPTTRTNMAKIINAFFLWKLPYRSDGLLDEVGVRFKKVLWHGSSAMRL
jgi:hypothetical protein